MAVNRTSNIAALLRANAPIHQQLRYRRRTTTRPPWVPPKEDPIVRVLDEDTRKYLESIEEVREVSKNIKLWAPLKRGADLFPGLPVENPQWTPESVRFGLLGRKLGMAPQWLNDGTRVLCTLIHIPENHVVSAIDPETYFATSKVGKRKAFAQWGPRWSVMVGAENVDPTFLTAAYRNIFDRAGVPYKEWVGNFLCTPDAIVAPGTKLDVRHFQIGQCVSVAGKTIDWGFQGVMHRWGMKGQPKRNTTKSHRRVGSIGTTGDAKVLPGRRLPGHMGWEWRVAAALQILRINPLKQIIYVKGCVPGEPGEQLIIRDTLRAKKNRVENPPFPTYVQQEEDVKPDYGETDITEIISHDIYAPQMHRFDSPSIILTEEHETKNVARDKSRAKLAKVKK